VHPLHCEVALEGAEVRWTRDGLATVFQSPTVRHEATASGETWTCHVTDPAAPDTQPPWAASVVIAGRRVAPDECPRDAAADAPLPTTREIPVGDWAITAHECPTQLGAPTVLYASLEAETIPEPEEPPEGDDAEGDDAPPEPIRHFFGRYSPVGSKRGTTLVALPAPEVDDPRPAGEDEEEPVWGFFALVSDAGTCFRGCADRHQLFAVSPLGQVLKLADIEIGPGLPPAYGFDEEGLFYWADRVGGTDHLDLFALEDRRTFSGGHLTRGDAPRAALQRADCDGAAIEAQVFDEDGADAGRAVKLSGEAEVLGYATPEGADAPLFEVKLGWQSIWTPNRDDPCAP